MKKIFNYLKEKKNFIGYYENLVKEIKIITSTPSDKVTEETLNGAISLLHKCEESIERMDKLVKSLNKLEKLILEETIIDVQFKKDCFKVRKDIIIALEEVVKLKKNIKEGI